jgi:methyl-accepting chemotaxis protein
MIPKIVAKIKSSFKRISNVKRYINPDNTTNSTIATENGAGFKAFFQSIRFKLLASLVSMIALMLLIFGINTFVESVNNKINKKMQDEMNLLSLTEEVHFNIINTDDTGSWYLLSRNFEYYTKYQVSIRKVNDLLKELEKYPNLSKEDLASIEGFKDEWTTYQTEKKETLELFRKGLVEESRVKYTEVPTSSLLDKFIPIIEKVNSNIIKYEKEMEQNKKKGKIVTLSALVISIIAAVSIQLVLGFLIVRPIILIGNQLKEIAEGEGDLTKQIEFKSSGEIKTLVISFNKMLENLRILIKEISSSTDQVAASANQLSASAEQSTLATGHISSMVGQVSEGSEQQVRSINDGVMALNDFTTTVDMISSLTEEVSTHVMKTSEDAESGGQTLGKVSSQMDSINVTVTSLSEIIKGLGDRSKEIENITKAITAISSQTNLLSLNAAIEAARAGEHGRGFAVVADEVRKLADQSASSAKQITNLVKTIQQETFQAVETMQNTIKEVENGLITVNEASKSFKAINQSIEGVVGQIQQVSHAVINITEGTKQLVTTIEPVKDIAQDTSFGMQEVSSSTEEQLATMQEISLSSNALAVLADDLQKSIGKFKF